MSELKPCPFCGGEPRMLFSHESGRNDVYIIECDPCGIDKSGEAEPTADLAKASAIVAWNTRATPSTDVADIAEKVRARCAEVCATLAETDLADGDQFEAALTCEAAIRALDLTDNGAPGVDRGEG